MHDTLLARRGAWFGFLAAASSGPGQTFFIGLFGEYMRGEFGLSDAALGVIYGIATLGSGLLMFWLGELADLLALRRAISLAVLLVAGGSVLVASAPAPWVLGLGLFALRLGGQGLAGHFAIVAAARYGGARTGRGVATTTLGFLLAEALYPLLVTAALRAIDWHTVWLVTALALLAIYLPVLRRLASPFPPAAAVSPAPGNPGDIDWNRRKLFASVPFLSGLGIVLFPSFVVTAIFFHQTSLAARLGWTPEQIARAFVIYALCHGTATILAGWLIDRFSARSLLRFHLLPLAAGLLAGFAAPPQYALWLLFAGLGMGSGGNAVVSGAIWVEVFGGRKLGLIRGVYAAAMVIMTATAPVVLGVLLSREVGISSMLAPLAIYAAVVPLLLAPFASRTYLAGISERT